MKLTKEQTIEDYVFFQRLWRLWRHTGNPEEGEDYWRSVVERMNALAKTKMQIEICEALLREYERRWKGAENDH